MKELEEMTPVQRNQYMVTQIISGKQSITQLSLDDLALAYLRLDGRVQLLKGQILLEARKRLSDYEFGYWVQENGLDSDTQQTRWNYMRLAEFYSNRETTGITPTVCIEIAKFAHTEQKLVNSTDLARKAHNHALGKNLSKKQILEYLDKLKDSMYIQKPTGKRYKPAPIEDVTQDYIEGQKVIVEDTQIVQELDDNPPVVIKQQIVEIYQQAEDEAQPYEDEIALILDLLKDKPLKVQEAIIKTCEIRLMEQYL